MNAPVASAPTPGKALVSANNFDLIRLLAALQVMLKHALVHLDLESRWTELLSLFPGVPIFFFISGFLIFQSYQNSPNLYRFSVNRVLRIYPALIGCFIVSVAFVLATGYLSLRELTTLRFWLWTIAQLSVFQFYNPEFLRGFGVGVINGSLWTISVELQFYFLTPALALLTLSRRGLWVLVIGIGMLANLALGNTSTGFAAKLYSVSSPPWFYMFALGAWLSTRQDLRERLLRLNPLVFLSTYAAITILGWYAGVRVVGNELNPLSYLLLAALVFRLAYGHPELSDRLLRRNDISYGVYIYHMPVLNLLIFYGISGTPLSVAAATLLTLAFALASWRFIERPALRLKKRALRIY